MKRNLYIIIMVAFWMTAFSRSPSAQEKSELSAAEISSVALVTNQINIGYAKLAKEKSRNEEVLKFAEMMIKDHMNIISQLAKINKKMKLTPKDNPVSQQLLADAAEARTSLTSKSGVLFDKAYIDNQVTYHQEVISKIEDLLFSQRYDGELNSLLQNLVPMLQVHLDRALSIQNKIFKI